MARVQCLFRDENDKIFRTYYINNRGDEAMGGVWSYLDVTDCALSISLTHFASSFA